MHISRKIFLSGLLLLGGLTLRAQSNQTQSNQVYDYSLKQCIDYAMQHRDSVINAGLDEKIADQRIRQTRAAGLPQINGSVGIQDLLIVPTQVLPTAEFASFGGIVQSLNNPAITNIYNGLISQPYLPVQFGVQYTASAGLTGSQLLFDGQYLTGLKAAKTFRELATRSADLTKVNVAANVTKAYYSVLINEKRTAVLDVNIDRLQKAFDQTKALNQQGFAEKLDVDRLSVTLNNLIVQRENIKNLSQLTYYMLKFQMGMPMNTELHLTDSLSDQNFPEPTVEQGDYKNRIEYNLLKTQRDLNALDLRRYRFQYVPNLVASGNLSTQAQRAKFADIFANGTGTRWYPTAIVGVTLNIPIFNGLATDALVQQAKLSMMKTQNTMANLENAINLQVTASSLNYQVSYKNLQIQRDNLKLAEENANVTKVKYDQGVGSNLEVITAEADLRQSQTNYFGALYDLMIAQVNLQLAKGTLKP